MLGIGYDSHRELGELFTQCTVHVFSVILDGSKQTRRRVSGIFREFLAALLVLPHFLESVIVDIYSRAMPTLTFAMSSIFFSVPVIMDTYGTCASAPVTVLVMSRIMLQFASRSVLAEAEPFSRGFFRVETAQKGDLVDMMAAQLSESEPASANRVF